MAIKRKINILIIFLILVITSTACIPGVSIQTQSQQETQTADEESPAVEPQLLNIDVFAGQETLVNLYENVNPGVVAIQVLSANGGGQGSGFIFDKQGHILTNFHVVDGANEIEVIFPSGIRARAEIVGTDLDSDIAVLKVDVAEKELYPLELGSSSGLKVGQTVIAIGNPFGLSGTMTAGIVSARGRTLESMRSAPGGGYFTAGDLIQTDAAINPGNSGGPLLDLNGRVIGINRAIRTDERMLTTSPVNSGVGFAIPIDIVKQVVPFLISEGKYEYPYLGITSRDELSILELEALGLPADTLGAYVLNVVENGPADKAGMRGGSRETEFEGLLAGGDLIVALEGQPIRNFSDLLSYLVTKTRPGDTVTFTVLRDGQKIDLEVTLAKRPD